jgi:DnaK suppressor protein
MAKKAKSNKRVAVKSPAKKAAKPKVVAKPKKAVAKAAPKKKPVAASKPAKSAKPTKPAKPQAKPVAKPAAKPASKAVPVKPAAKVPPKSMPAPVTKLPPQKSAKAATAPQASSAKSSTKPTAAAAKQMAPTLFGALKLPEVGAPKPAPRVSGPRAVAVAAPKTKNTNAKVTKKPVQPIKVVGNEVVRVTLPRNYRPSTNEEYMSPNQLEYFRQKLLAWRVELVEESKQTIDNLREEVRDVGDEAERATRETENSLELRTRDRYRKLIGKIDKALRRIEDGEYGFCEDTGEEIGLERLEARPIATLCLDAQERWEHRRRLMGD